MASGLTSGFHLTLSGELAGVQIIGADDVYCKFSFNYGVDWRVMHGLEHGITQVARNSISTSSPDAPLVWNYPVELSLRSTNAHGWPQIVFSVYRTNAMGLDVIAGYGCIHVPTTPGRHVRYVRLYAPVSSSLCQRFMAWVQGSAPEFFNAQFVSQGRAREVTRVRSNGTLKIILNVATKNFSEWGYDNSVTQASISQATQAALSSVTTASAAQASFHTPTTSSNYAGIAPFSSSRVVPKSRTQPLYSFGEDDETSDQGLYGNPSFGSDDDDIDESRDGIKRGRYNEDQQLFGTLRSRLHTASPDRGLSSTASGQTNNPETASYSSFLPFETEKGQGSDVEGDLMASGRLRSNRVLAQTPERDREQRYQYTPNALGSPISSSHDPLSPRREKAAEKASLLDGIQGFGSSSPSVSTMGSTMRQSTVVLPESYSAISASSMLGRKNKSKSRTGGIGDKNERYL